MAMRRRPPVIPEIAKAYQNDPRTQLAMQSLATGSSIAPVAEGKYGMADGVARMLTGLGGAYANKKQMEGYEEIEAAKVAKMNAMGVANAPAAPGVANAGQIATALGAPPPAPAAPPTPPQSAPGLPMAPIPAPAPVGPQMQGVGPGAARPFGPSAAAPPAKPTQPAYLAIPEPEVVPDAPAPIARPNAPDAVGPTRSRLLDAAYKLMSDGDAFDYAPAQAMYKEGLGDQTKLDESASERRQRLIDMGYQTDLGMYGDAASQDRNATYEDRRGAQGRNFQSRESALGRNFEAGESALTRGFQANQSALDRSFQATSQARAQRFQQAQGDRDFEHQKILQDLKTGQERKNYAQQYIATKAGKAQIGEYAKAINASSSQLSILNAFEQKLKSTKTGGLLLGNAPGLVTWSSSDLKTLEGYTNALVANNAKLLPGALSDKEGARLESMGPNIRRTKRSNQEGIDFLKGVAQRQKAFALGQAHALRKGEDIDFLDSWSAYTDNVPVTDKTTYDQWLASIPKYDANGQQVK